MISNNVVMPDRSLLLRQDLELVEDILTVFTHENELHEVDDVLSAKGRKEFVNTKRVKDLLAEVAKLSDDESDTIFTDFPWLAQFVALKNLQAAEQRGPTPEPTPEPTPAAAPSVVTETPPTERATPPTQKRPKKRSLPHVAPRRSPRLKTPRRSPRKINRNRRR